MKIFNKKQITVLILIFTAVLTGLYFYLNREIQPTVASSTPGDGDTEVLETAQISINFASTVQEKAKNDISAAIDPNTPFDGTWLNNTYKIIPKNSLQNNTTYKINVLFKNSPIYNFSFQTATFSQQEINKYGGLQSQNDYEFGQVSNTFINKNPWFSLLPVITPDYTIYYDATAQKFSIAFTVKPTSQDEENTLVQKALTDLRKIGVKDPIQYYVFQP